MGKFFRTAYLTSIARRLAVAFSSVTAFVFSYIALPMVLIISFFGVIVVIFAIWFLVEQRTFGPDAEYISFLSGTMKFINISWRSIFESTSISEIDKRIVSEYANIFVFSLSLFAIIASSLYVFKERQAVRRQSPYFAKNFVATAGEINNYAVPIMLNYFLHAEELYIVSGDFDWLFSTDDSDVCELLSSRCTEGKAILLSYKSPEAVFNSWKRYPKTKEYKSIFCKIYFNCDVSIKASMIRYRNGFSSLIFLSDMSDSGASSPRKYSIFEYTSSGTGSHLIVMFWNLLGHTIEVTKRKAASVAQRRVILDNDWWS